VRKNIAVRASKFARQAGDEGVYINVRGIRGAARVRKLGKAGANNPNDPYYWWWQEFGWIPQGRGHALKGGKRRQEIQRSAQSGRKIPGKKFMTNAVRTQGEAAITKFMQSVIPQIEKLNARAAKK
jgi:hypothetical protein